MKQSHRCDLQIEGRPDSLEIHKSSFNEFVKQKQAVFGPSFFFLMKAVNPSVCEAHLFVAVLQEGCAHLVPVEAGFWISVSHE